MKKNELIESQVVAYLKDLKKRGFTSTEATKALQKEFLVSAQASTLKRRLFLGAIPGNELIRPGNYGPSMVRVFAADSAGSSALTPLSLAQDAKLFYEDPDDVALAVASGFPDMTATEVGRILLDPTIYPDLTASEMSEALSFAGFSDAEVTEAINALFKPAAAEFVVESVPKWQDSGVTVDAGEQVSIQYLSGKWTANPATGMVTAAGNKRYKAKPGYTLPGAREGALCGRVGGQHVFLVGTSAAVPPGLTGKLEFCINDDLRGQFGAGFTDNRGSVTIQITETQG